MKNKATQTANTVKKANFKNLKQLSKNQLETIVGGDDPPTSRGTKTDSQD